MQYVAAIQVTYTHLQAAFYTHLLWVLVPHKEQTRPYLAMTWQGHLPSEQITTV